MFYFHSYAPVKFNSGNVQDAGMARSKSRREQPLTNEVSDETGQYDARFVLWRRFCAANDLPVETLPSQLSPDAKVKWEKLKAERLKPEQ